MNPYSTPTSELSSPVEPTQSIDSAQQLGEMTLGQIAKPIFRAWERLRVVYVLLLGSLTLLITGSNIFKSEVFLEIMASACAANLCFFAGPCAETYVRWLGYRGSLVRWFLFLTGTLVAAILVVATLSTHMLPNQN